MAAPCAADGGSRGSRAVEEQPSLEEWFRSVGSPESAAQLPDDDDDGARPARAAPREARPEIKTVEDLRQEREARQRLSPGSKPTLSLSAGSKPTLSVSRQAVS